MSMKASAFSLLGIVLCVALAVLSGCQSVGCSCKECKCCKDSCCHAREK